MKKQLLQLVNTNFATTMLQSIERLDSGSDQILRVLTYHRVDAVDAHPNLSKSTLSATPSGFEAQMSYIADNYTAVSIDDVLAYIHPGTPLPPKAILITFDDAYTDFQKYAWDILKAHHIPVVLFVPTAYPDNPQKQLWWDQLYHAVQSSHHDTLTFGNQSWLLEDKDTRNQVYKILRNMVKELPHDEAMAFVGQVCQNLDVSPHPHNHIMTWEQLRALQLDGVTLAPHTHNHPMLNRLPVEEAVAEAAQSMAILEERTGTVPAVFAYPSGGANVAIADALQNIGFKLAFTTQRGINDMRHTNPLLIRRINVGLNTSVNVLRIQLLSIMANLSRN